MRFKKLGLIVVLVIFVVFAGFAQSTTELLDLYQKYQSGNLSQSDMQRIMELKDQFTSESGGLDLGTSAQKRELPEQKDKKDKVSSTDPSVSGIQQLLQGKTGLSGMQSLLQNDNLKKLLEEKTKRQLKSIGYRYWIPQPVQGRF